MKRSVEESKENLDQIGNSAPESKFQTSQQIQETDDAKLNPGESGGFAVERRKTPGAKLKQEVVAKTIKDASYGGSNAGDGLNAAGRSVSGDAGGVLGAANMTPKADQSRRDSRYGKKLDRNSTKVNFIPNEQVLEEYDESKPLAESADSDQGYNGTYRNEFARSQKKVGNTPSDLMFSRSLDLIEKDMLYWPQGQYVKQSGVSYQETPTITKVKDAMGRFVDGNPGSYDVKRGNYHNRSMILAFDANKKVRFMTFDTRDVTPTVSAADANKSSSAGLRDRNYDELYREVIDSKAGDEKADIWSPLARAVRQPTATVGYLKDIEAMTGSEIGTAYKKATTSHSFQLNRAHKDGQDLITPVFDAFRGMFKSVADSDDLISPGESIQNVFDYADEVKGSASLMIDAYDSRAKYKTKADFLVQPRSLRMHLQTADNNMDPFRIPKNFVSIFDNQEVFSTIDREYDPLLPICMTDKCALLTRLSYADLFTWVRKAVKLNYDSSGSYTASKSVILVPAAFCAKASGQYLHLRFDKSGVQTTPTINTSTGVITINNNVEKDITIWIDTTATYSDTDDYKFANFDLSTSAFASTGVSFTTTAKYARLEVIDDELLFPLHAGPFYYGYSDLRNEYVTRVAFPLLEGIWNYFCDSGVGILKLISDPNWVASGTVSTIYSSGWVVPIVHSTRHFSLWSFIVCAATPYIINSRINSMRDVLYYEKNVEYPFSELIPLKDMTTRGYSNFTYADYDHELECKVMTPATALKWTMPEFWTKVGKWTDSDSATYELTLAPWYFNENNYSIDSNLSVVVEDDDMSCMSMPSIRSGAKLASLDELYGISEKDIRLSFDMISSIAILLNDSTKMNNAYDANGAYKYGIMTDGIPYFSIKTNGVTVIDMLTLPREVGYCMDAPYGLLTANVGDSALTDPAGLYTPNGTSHRVTYWIANGATKFVPGSGQVILDATEVNVNRAANFKQKFYSVYANGKQAPFDHGMAMSVNSLFADDGSAVTGATMFTPFTDFADGQLSSNSGLNSVMSFMKAIWTRIQKLPFVISPFDAVAIASTRTNIADPYDFAYWFGLCGFRASDFRESVYNREKQVINQGNTFVTDPWVNDSPCFKEGAVSSSTPLTTGFRM